MSHKVVLVELHKELLKKYPSPFSMVKRIQYRSVLSELEGQIKKAQAEGCTLLESFEVLAKHFPDKPNRLAWATAWSQMQKERAA